MQKDNKKRKNVMHFRISLKNSAGPRIKKRMSFWTASFTPFSQIAMTITPQFPKTSSDLHQP